MASDDFEPTLIVEQLRKVLGLVETSIKRLKAAMGPKGADVEHDKEHIAALEKLARTALELSKECRAWAKTSKELGKKLTQAEKISLTIQFINKLPPVERHDLIKAITR